jgi:DNA-binding NarL/FixJ family response regulator
VSDKPVAILCVDRFRLIREGLALILDREPDLAVVATAGTGEEAIALFRAHRPDVTLIDLQLPRLSGLDAIRRIVAIDRCARVVVLTTYEGDEDIHAALDAGASAYLLKDTSPDRLVRTIRAVHAGERPLGPEVMARLAERAHRVTLTGRQLEVLRLMGRGLRNKAIGAVLGISELTVAVHVKNILAKLNARDRVTAINEAQRRGIIHLE